jgi:hypothetical protein
MLFAFYAVTEIREEQLSNRQFLCTHILLQVETYVEKWYKFMY